MTLPSGRRPLVVNVDDTEPIRYARTRVLERAGFEVAEAATGAEALRLVAALRPPVILLDVKLPDMSGLEVCRIVKRDFPSVLVLQISAAFVSGADKVRGLDGGADYYLIQPVGPEELVAVVRALLRLSDAEEALRRSNATLEERVAERTRALDQAIRVLHQQIEERERAEEALRKAQKLEAIGQLTGGIAHDFNNMLTAITGNIDLLQRRLAEGRTDVDRFAQAALLGAERVAFLTQRLLAFSRRQVLAPRALDLNRLIGTMAELICRTVGEQVRFETAFADDLWPAWCDANQLESALLNLAINSRDAMPQGGRLTVTTANLTVRSDDPLVADGIAPGDYAVVSVGDSGAGMSADVVSKAFDPFFTTKPIGQGTGLGLSMLYGFVRQSDGHAQIESAPERGTTVRLYLPRYVGLADAGIVDEARLGAPRLAGAGRTILLVEDEALVRLMLYETLKEAGHDVIEAGDGETALRQLAGDGSVQLMVTDIGLPGMNGLQLAEAARALRPDLQVLFMTGYALIGRGEAALPDGIEILNKPFAAKVLASRVREMIDRRPVIATAP